MNTPFEPWPKIARLSRECVISEKLDGTNSSIKITDEGEFLIGSRTRWISPEDDNFGFARWARSHETELRTLGVGHHYGEWYGAGIQRNYGLKEKKFALFNTLRWIESEDERFDSKQEIVPACCGVVPILYRGLFDTAIVNDEVERLRSHGSVEVPGFPRPEGVIVYHIAAGVSFKKLLEKDELPKGIADKN